MSFLESLSNALTFGIKADIADVPVGGGIVLINGPYVVTQSVEGAFHVSRKNCTHQMHPVNEVTNEDIHCSAHGSVFVLSDGHPLCGPAECPLRGAKVEVRGNRLAITGQTVRASLDRDGTLKGRHPHHVTIQWHKPADEFSMEVVIWRQVSRTVSEPIWAKIVKMAALTSFEVNG